MDHTTCPLVFFSYWFPIEREGVRTEDSGGLVYWSCSFLISSHRQPVDIPSPGPDHSSTSKLWRCKYETNTQFYDLSEGHICRNTELWHTHAEIKELDWFETKTCEIKVSLWLSKSECTGVLALPQNLPWASVTRDLLDQIHKPTSPFYKLEQVFLFGSICICIVFVFVVAIVQWSQRQWDQLRCYHKPTLITSLHRNLNLSICNRPGQPSFHSTKTFWTCIISSH